MVITSGFEPENCGSIPCSPIFIMNIRRSAQMKNISTIKCDYIPSCIDCKLNTPDNLGSCEVGLPQYIPDAQVERLLQEFKKRNYK